MNPIKLPQIQEEVKTVVLTVGEINLDPKGLWVLVYDGFVIRAKVEDEVLLQMIKSKERFSSGDSIEVELRIEKELIPACKVYKNKNFKIVKYIKSKIDAV